MVPAEGLCRSRPTCWAALSRPRPGHPPPFCVCTLFFLLCHLATFSGYQSAYVSTHISNSVFSQSCKLLVISHVLQISEFLVCHFRVYNLFPETGSRKEEESLPGCFADRVPAVSLAEPQRVATVPSSSATEQQSPGGVCVSSVGVFPPLVRGMLCLSVFLLPPEAPMMPLAPLRPRVLCPRKRILTLTCWRVQLGLSLSNSVKEKEKFFLNFSSFLDYSSVFERQS